MEKQKINSSLLEDNSNGFRSLSEIDERNQKRKINLIITEEGSRFHIRGVGDGLDAFENWEDDIPLSKQELWAAVQKCRQAWQTAVKSSENGGLPLQDGVKQTPELLGQILPSLALAGSRLFETIFFPIDAQKYPGLANLGHRLRELTAEGSIWIRVTSECCFAPWSLMYSRDPGYDGKDTCKEGFWGYEHLVEHVPKAGSITNCLRGEGTLRFASHLDTNIDQSLGVECNVLIDNLLRRYEQLNSEARNDKPTLYKALKSSPHNEHILYFCCHGVVGGDPAVLSFTDNQLELTDKQPITAADIKSWMQDGTFTNKPLVFLNMCQGAQIDSPFYRAFAETFLAKDASAVIGPETDMPAIFAGQFACRFLDRFFAGGQFTVGSILFDLRRNFVDQFNNPLGLLYSLYRGADVRLENALPKKCQTNR
jgi:hypothetical protein